MSLPLALKKINTLDTVPCTVECTLYSAVYTVQCSVLYSDVTVQCTERVTPRDIGEISQFHAIVPPRLYSKLVHTCLLCHLSRMRRELVLSSCCFFSLVFHHAKTISKLHLGSNCKWDQKLRHCYIVDCKAMDFG